MNKDIRAAMLGDHEAAKRLNNCRWLVTMDAEDWFQLYRDWEITEG